MIPILACLFILILWIAYQRHKGDRTTKKQSETFWAREREANLSRRKDLSSLDYITIPYENLPFSNTSDTDVLYIQNQLESLRDQKIVNLTGLTNTDLKLSYGAANINILSVYDQNFTILIRNLNKWGELLLRDNNIAAATTVLEYAISCGSDITQTFLSLAGIYLDHGDHEKLTKLRGQAEQISTPLKEQLLSKLKVICEKASHDLK
jgi:hypothetical protein